MLVLRPIPRPDRAGACDAWGAPDAAGIIEDTGDATPFAEWRGANPIGAPPLPSPEPLAPRLATWSGWIGADDQSPSLLTWTSAGWDGLNRWLDAALPAIGERAQTLLLRPHAGHVLSDPRSCLTLLQQRETPTLRLLLDPVAMLTPGMLADAPDHTRRILDTLLDHPATEAVILSDASPAGDALSHAPLGRGALAPALLDRLIERVRAARAHTVLLGDPGPQIARLAPP